MGLGRELGIDSFLDMENLKVQDIFGEVTD